MKVLILDSRDSFTFNLAQAFGELGADASVVTAGAVDAESILAAPPGLVCIGPGPRGPRDLPPLVDLVRLLLGKVPLFGVCLGMQVIVQSDGGTIGYAEKPVHGQRSMIDHEGRGLFQDLPSPLRVMRYHSLIATHLPEVWSATAHDDRGQLMAIADDARDAYAVQFHPESIGTEGGLVILANLLRMMKFEPTVGHRRGGIPAPGHPAW